MERIYIYASPAQVFAMSSSYSDGAVVHVVVVVDSDVGK